MTGSISRVICVLSSMTTTHTIILRDSRNLHPVEPDTVDLVVTSPPYPMIEMWDNVFSSLNPLIGKTLQDSDGSRSFELMHCELDKVWREAYRLLSPGGIACINIGDATRTIDGNFRLYPNNARILSACIEIGFSVLPEILWRKQTNAPNKFMGSGMLPPSAYVTLEHEFILVLRKGPKREFKTNAEKKARADSAYFWEERNIWFSDVWDFKGTDQALNHHTDAGRPRSGAFPFELPYRLINMYSIKGDTVFDPFLGTGTTTLAAVASCRNSLGAEADSSLHPLIESEIVRSTQALNDYIRSRFFKHIAFTERYDKQFKHVSRHYGFPVITNQETELIINYIERTRKTSEGEFESTYLEQPVIDPNILPFSR